MPGIAEIQAASRPVGTFRPYQPKVKGFDNRLTLDNILKLSSLTPAQVKDLLLKAGWNVQSSNNSLYKSDHYAGTSDVLLYAVGFTGAKKGFGKLIIYKQPEMRMIEASLLAGGYKVTQVKPRQGARWTKIYQKSGYPTYSISMMLMPGMNSRAQTYDYDEYMYCLICEKNI